MTISEKMQAQGGKPSGFLGRLIGNLMNFFHRRIYDWGLESLTLKADFTCLDVGCGGGGVVKILAEKANMGKTCGLDHSAEMVRLSCRQNKTLIARGLVKIKQGTVSVLPYPDKYFDLITAFETIQFWPDLKNDLLELKRVLKPTGKVLIINRYPPENSKWADFLQLKNAGQYEKQLNLAGFSSITLDTESKKGWIKVIAMG